MSCVGITDQRQKLTLVYVPFSEQKQPETILCCFLQTTIIPNETSSLHPNAQTFLVWTFKPQQEFNTRHLHNITLTLHSDRLIYLHAGNSCLQRADRWNLLGIARLLQALNFCWSFVNYRKWTAKEVYELKIVNISTLLPCFGTFQWENFFFPCYWKL